ncbi:MAG: DNA primase [Planctomycetes bacterium]|nr:DNA primase [Planctomycetota bacterium]NUQ33575.1 DNA primase [Planctomycetaceae bacterium]
MPRISQDSIRRVREANDIVDVVGRYVNLRRAGATFKALCPFHKENTPSFTVSPQRQTFKCFGCGVGGSVVDFTMQMEKLDFVETIERLAERASIPLEYEQGSGGTSERPAASSSTKATLYRVMEWAQKRYAATLEKSSDAQSGRDYLRERGVSQEIIDSWGLGFAPESFDAVLTSGMREFGSAEFLDSVGLTRVNEAGKRYDFFRNRLLFPIRDASGRVVAFGARKMDENDPGGKYINSPATPIYEKSRVLYGIDRLATSQYNRAHAKGGKLVIVVEGYFDVIACHKAGLDCAVAPCGTSITPDQIHTLRRFGDRIVLIMDGDAAGQASMERIAGEVIAQGADVTAVTIPGGLDPDDYLNTHTAEDFLALIANGKDLFRFKLEALSKRYDLTRIGARLEAAEEALTVVSMATNEMLRDIIVRKTAEFFDVDETALRARLRSKARSAKTDQAQPAGQTAISVPPDERLLLLSLLRHPELIPAVAEFLASDDFETPVAAAVYRAVLDCREEIGELRFPDVFDFLDQEKSDARSFLAGLMEGDLSLRNAPKDTEQEAMAAIKSAITQLRHKHVEQSDEYRKRVVADNHEELTSRLALMRSMDKRRGVTKP